MGVNEDIKIQDQDPKSRSKIKKRALRNKTHTHQLATQNSRRMEMNHVSIHLTSERHGEFKAR